MKNEWSGWVLPNGHDNYWVDDETGEIIDTVSGERRLVQFVASSEGHKCFNGLVAIIRPLTFDEADIDDVGLMFECRAPDGAMFSCFVDELHDKAFECNA